MPTVKVAFKGDATSMSRAGKEAEGVLDKLRGKVGMLPGMIGGALAGIGISQVTAQIGELFNEFDRLAKLSSRLDIDVETFQKLSRLAELNGTDIEALAKAMTRLKAAYGDADGEGEKVAETLKSLGIDAEKFIGMRLDAQVLELSAAYERSGGSAKAFSDVLELLGLRAADLIPLLKAGPDAAREAMDNMNVVSADAVASIERMNDAWGELVAELKAAVAGPLGDVAGMFLDIVNSANELGITEQIRQMAMPAWMRAYMEMRKSEKVDPILPDAPVKKDVFKELKTVTETPSLDEAFRKNFYALEKANEAAKVERRKATGSEDAMVLLSDEQKKLVNRMRAWLEKGGIGAMFVPGKNEQERPIEGTVRPEMLISDLARQGGAAGLTGGFTPDMLGVQKESRDILKRIERKLAPANAGTGAGAWV